MHCTVQAMPSVGPYWRARAVDSAATWDISLAYSSGGKVLVSGRPPAKEITSGRSVRDIMSRIADVAASRAFCSANTAS